MTPKQLLNVIPAKEIQIALHKRRSARAETNGCVRWLGQISTQGYGMVPMRSRRFSAHRAAWVAKNGPLDTELSACHTCDNRWCVNPDHVFPGTVADNAADAVSKGRLHFQTSPETIAFVPGEKHPRAKLTTEDVAEIRKLYAVGGHSQRELGRMYGVHQGTIQKIVSNKRWNATIRALAQSEPTSSREG